MKKTAAKILAAETGPQRDAPQKNDARRANERSEPTYRYQPEEAGDCGEAPQEDFSR